MLQQKSLSETGLPGRILCAILVLVPVAVGDLLAGQPFAISAIASTAAIVLHAPDRYRRRPWVIVGCYLSALLLAVPFTLGGAMLAWQAPVTAAVAAAVLVATRAAHIHPPVACIPLAILGATDATDLALRWVEFVATAAWSLTFLWVLTLRWDRSGAK